jgi:hypothetical protein
MASCGYCGTTILFGGKRDGELRFCNAECQQKGLVAAVAQEVPDALVSDQVWKVHQGLCPKCGSSGPVDAVFSLAFGWWGFPWGLIMTPVQIFRNVAGLLNATDPMVPSPQLGHIIRLHIAANAFEASRTKDA